MTTKSYTTVEQSLKLVEILPLESADGFYPNRIDIEYQGVLPIECKHGTPLLSQEIPAWSLSALLDCLPHIQEYYPIIGKINDGIVVLGTGKLEKKLTVKATRFTKTASEKIEALGGKIEVI